MNILKLLIGKLSGMTKPILRTCIICRKAKPISDFNVEHIILDTIGGDLKIHTVCSVCNSSLSKNFNKPFLSDPNIGICRKILSLNRSGSNRDIKNPLKRAKVDGKDAENYYIQFDNGLPKVVRKPETEIKQEEDGYKVIIHGKPDALENIMEEILKKYGYYESQILNLKKEVTKITRTISFETKAQAIILEALKVAYEFTVTFLPDYFNVEWANEYSAFLETGIINDFIKERIDSAATIQKVCSVDYEELSKLPTHQHAIFIKSYPNFGLVCIVKLFNFFTFNHLSEKCLLDVGKETLLINEPIVRKSIFVVD